MLLDDSLIFKMFKGCEYVEYTNDGYEIFRFTKTELESYEYMPVFYERCFSTAGVRMDFYTDSDMFEMEYTIKPHNVRKFYGFDVEINGVITHYRLGDTAYQCCDTISFTLDKSKNHIVIYFPCSVKAIVKSVKLGEGARVWFGEDNEKFLLCYGDSITQGYDARHPSQNYVALLASYFNADFINKGIGGDVMHSFNLTPPERKADIITVAYGTNDWGKKRTPEEFECDATEYYNELVRQNPSAKIFVISPIWRADWTAVKPVGTFNFVRNTIYNICSKHNNIKVIDGMSLTPHEPSFFADERVHPNDLGFRFYAQNLYNNIHKYISKEM